MKPYITKNLVLAVTQLWQSFTPLVVVVAVLLVLVTL